MVLLSATAWRTSQIIASSAVIARLVACASAKEALAEWSWRGASPCD